MSAWWQRLSVRDRRVLRIGTLVVGAVLFWALLWDPLAQARRTLAADAVRREADLAWMHEVAPQLRAPGVDGAQTLLERGGASLLALADASAREAGLDVALRRVEPVSEGRVNVWFEGASFDQLVAWLDGLGQRYGVGVDELSVDRVEGVGLVNARVGLIDAPRR